MVAVMLSKSSTLTKRIVLRNGAGSIVCMLLIGRSFASSGSNQAREGRLVDALAVRGDEGRGTLR